MEGAGARVGVVLIGWWEEERDEVVYLKWSVRPRPLFRFRSQCEVLKSQNTKFSDGDQRPRGVLTPCRFNAYKE